VTYKIIVISIKITKVLVTIQLLSQDINNNIFLVYNNKYLCY